MRLAARIATAAAVAAVLTAGAAQAATVGFPLRVSGDPNVPTFVLANLSDREAISGFGLTIGDATRNFDEILLGAGPMGGTATLLFGSASQGGSSATGGRTDASAIGHTGFVSGQSSTFTADIDRDDANTIENYRLRFFNNGAAPNSVVTVTYDTGRILDLALPDQATVATSYTFAETIEVAPIPLPAGLSLLGSALLGIAIAAQRRRRT